MSRAKKCDRCGALYQPERGCVWLENYQLCAPENGKELWAGYEADLCPACSAEFIKWLGVEYNDDEKPSQGESHDQRHDFQQRNFQHLGAGC